MSIREKLVSKGAKWWVPRILSGCIGLIILFSGLIKAGDMELFIRQISDYNIISGRIPVILTAWGLIAAECALGTALLISFRTFITVPVTSFMLVVFVCVTGYAWISGATEDCGCFGNWVNRSPGGAMIEDIVMLAALVPSWVWRKKSTVNQPRTKSIIMIAACVAGFVLPLFTGFTISRITGPAAEGTYIKEDLLDILSPEPFDLKIGEHIIVVMSTDCLHCRESVTGMNRIAWEEDLPDILALTPNRPEQVENFKELFDPSFPVLRIAEDNFWELLGDVETPRTILIKDRRILDIWNENLPDVKIIREALSQ